MNDTEPITTATSESEGRLKVGISLHRLKKNRLKRMVVKFKVEKGKDGKGGPVLPGLGTMDPSGVASASPGVSAAYPSLSSSSIGGNAGLGASPSQPMMIPPNSTSRVPSVRMTSKIHRASTAGMGGLRMKGAKAISSTINSLNRKMKFNKVLNSIKPRSLKSRIN